MVLCSVKSNNQRMPFVHKMSIMSDILFLQWDSHGKNKGREGGWVEGGGG